MNDLEFLDYCMAMTKTERCGFVPSNIARLLYLAGENDLAKEWEKEPNYIVSGCHDAIENYVKKARARIAELEKEKP
jgi:hypothetical protein